MAVHEIPFESLGDTLEVPTYLRRPRQMRVPPRAFRHTAGDGTVEHLAAARGELLILLDEVNGVRHLPHRRRLRDALADVTDALSKVAALTTGPSKN